MSLTHLATNNGSTLHSSLTGEHTGDAPKSALRRWVLPHWVCRGVPLLCAEGNRFSLQRASLLSLSPPRLPIKQRDGDST